MGHFLLEINGSNRSWVTTDSAQLTVIRLEGPSPIGDLDPDGHLTVLVNSRFFRGKTPEDVTLTVTQYEQGRFQSLRGDGFEMSLPEHPGPFPDWKEALNKLIGHRVRVDSRVLLEACYSADVVPRGVESDDPVSAWIFVESGRLVLEAPWLNYPNTKVFMEAECEVEDSVPVLISPLRLSALLLAIDPARVILTLPPDPLGVIGIEYDNYQALLMPIDRWGAQRAKVEELLCEFLGVDSIDPDADGDYGVTTPEGNQLWVRLHTEARPISAQVFSVLASGVECTNELLAEMNSINSSAAYVKVMWADGAVMAETDIVAEVLDMSELANALTVVQETADRYRGVLSSFFGDGS